MSTPNLIERHPGLTYLSIKNRPAVSKYGVNAAVTVDAAWAASTAMFEVPLGGTFRSDTLKRNRLGIHDESRRGLTLASYNINDYASATIPGDAAIAFVRIEDFDKAGVSMGEGPILAVPPSGFFATGRRNLVLTGTAPEVAAGSNGLPPTGSMVLTTPRFADEVTISNTDGANDLFVSFGEGLQEYTLASGLSATFTEAGVDSLYLRSDAAGGATFVATLALVNGIQA